MRLLLELEEVQSVPVEERVVLLIFVRVCVLEDSIVGKTEELRHALCSWGRLERNDMVFWCRDEPVGLEMRVSVWITLMSPHDRQRLANSE